MINNVRLLDHIWYFRCIIIFAGEDRPSHTLCITHFAVVELGLTLLDACVLSWLCYLYSLNRIFEFVLLGFGNTHNIVLFCIFRLLYPNNRNLFFNVFVLYLSKWCKLFSFFVGLSPLLLIIIIISKWFRRLLLIYFYKRLFRSIEYLLEARLFIVISSLIPLILIFRFCQRLLYLRPLHDITLLLPTFMRISRACWVNWLIIFFLMIVPLIYFYFPKGTLFCLLPFRFTWASGVNWFIIVLEWSISMLIRIPTDS